MSGIRTRASRLTQKDARFGGLPSFRPHLHVVMPRSMSGCTCTLDDLAVLARSRLKAMQYRPALLDGFIAETGLTLEPP
jgi:hypothetical protein